MPRLRYFSANSSMATSAELSHTLLCAKSKMTRLSGSSRGSSFSVKLWTEPKKSGPVSSHRASEPSICVRETSMRCDDFHAKPRADNTTPANTATAKFVATVTPVTSNNTKA